MSVLRPAELLLPVRAVLLQVDRAGPEPPPLAGASALPSAVRFTSTTLNRPP